MVRALFILNPFSRKSNHPLRKSMLFFIGNSKTFLKDIKDEIISLPQLSAIVIELCQDT